MAEGLGEWACRDDLRLVQINSEPNAAEARSQCGEEAANGRGGARAEAVIEEEGADIDASGVQGLSGGACLGNDRVNSQCKEYRTEGVPLLHTPSAVDGLQSDMARSGEQCALMAVTAVDPWREGREMNANGPQDSCTMNRVKGVGNVNRDSNLVRVGVVTRKPLPSNMNDRLAPIGCLNPELQRFKNLTCPLGDQIHSDLAGEPADGFTNSDWPQRPIGFAKGHDGRPTNIWPNRLWNLTPKQEADHLREEPKKQVGRSRAQRIADMRRTEPGSARTRSRRERHESLANLISVRRWGRTRSDCTKRAHFHTIIGGRTRVKEAKRRDDILRGTDRGVLQQCRTSTTKSTLLDKSCNSGNDRSGKDATIVILGRRVATLRRANGRRIPKISPDATEPVQTTTAGLTLLTKNMLPATAGGSR